MLKNYYEDGMTVFEEKICLVWLPQSMVL